MNSISYADLVVDETTPRHKFDFLPLCASPSCIKDAKSRFAYGQSRNLHYAVLNVRRDESHCPQCGHAIFWMRRIQDADPTKRPSRRERCRK